MRLTLKEVKDYLKAQIPSIENAYIGTIDKSKEKCVGIYPRAGNPSIIALGGLENTSYGVLPISILVHWTKNTDTCEKQANLIYEFLINLQNVEIEGHRIITIQMLDSGPIDLLRDENNICEMVIRAKIFYEREGS